MKLKLQDFYIELLKKKGPFIEEAIETPKDKLVDNIASLLNISPNKYNIKKFLEESSEEAKDLILLAEQFEFKSPFKFLSLKKSLLVDNKHSRSGLLFRNKWKHHTIIYPSENLLKWF